MNVLKYQYKSSSKAAKYQNRKAQKKNKKKHNEKRKTKQAPTGTISC